MSEPSITNVSSDELDDMKSQTDWKALQAKTDADIQQDIASDPDTHILDADWFQGAQGVMPSSEKKRMQDKRSADS